MYALILIALLLAAFSIYNKKKSQATEKTRQNGYAEELNPVAEVLAIAALLPALEQIHTMIQEYRTTSYIMHPTRIHDTDGYWLRKLVFNKASTSYPSKPWIQFKRMTPLMKPYTIPHKPTRNYPRYTHKERFPIRR